MFPMLPFPDVAEFSLFTLVLGRIGGLFSAIPLFGGKSVPARIKIAISFAMALVFFPIIRPGLPVLPADALSLGLLVVRETLIGLSLGLLSQVIFSAVEFCGQVIGLQMGFSAAAQFDPTMGTQVSVLSMMQNLLAVLLFMVLGMHHIFIKAIIESYGLVPVGAWHVSGGLLQFIIAITTGIFILAVKLAAPVMASILASTVALGVMARSFPQMNVFMVSLPLSIGLGFIILGVTLPVFFRILGSAFHGMDQQITALFKLLGG